MKNVYWSLLNSVHISLIQGAREPYLGHKNIAVFKLQVSTVEPFFFLKFVLSSCNVGFRELCHLEKQNQ